MDIAPGDKTATFTSEHYDLKMQLPRDMAMLHLSFLDDRQGSAISSSMDLVMHKPFFAAKSKDYIQNIFLGPVHLDNHFQGYLVAVVLSEQGQERELTNPTNVCIAFNAKAASTTKISSSTVSRTLLYNKEPESKEALEDANSGQPHFAVNNQSHEFRGTIGISPSGKHALELSFAPHYKHELSSSKDWSVVTIPQLEKHEEVLLEMVSGFGSNGIITISNDSDDVVTATIKPASAKWFSIGISATGVILAVLGMPTISSPLVGICVAWSGLLLAIGSFADTLSRGNDSKSMVLFPNDKMGKAKTGWFTYWGIIIVENVIEEEKQGSKLIGKSYRIPTTTFYNYYVKDMRLTDDKNKRTLFRINPGTESYLSYLRLLGIRGVQPQTFLVKGDPVTPQQGDVLSYDQNGAIVGSWGRAFDTGEDYFLRAKNANKDTQIAIVQEGNDAWGQVRNVRIYHLVLDPYSPALYIENAEIVSNIYSTREYKPIGTVRTTEDVLKRI